MSTSWAEGQKNRILKGNVEGLLVVMQVIHVLPAASCSVAHLNSWYLNEALVRGT